MLTLLLYCLAQCGQQTGAEAMVPVSWVWVLSMGSGSPGPAGRSFLMLGGSSEPGWFFRMWAFLLLALLYTCGDTGGDHGVAKAGFGFAVGTQDLASFIRT